MESFWLTPHDFPFQCWNKEGKFEEILITQGQALLLKEQLAWYWT